MCGAATITSPAVMSAMRITPSSIMRDSGSISSLCSASASDSISSSRESGPGDDEFDELLEQRCAGRRALRGLVAASRGAGGCGSDIGSDGSGAGCKAYRNGESLPRTRQRALDKSATLNGCRRAPICLGPLRAALRAAALPTRPSPQGDPP